jgi:diadenosine tetraphosphate (Ap4A) HIT family hydrolase
MAELHPQLAQDCLILGRFPLCHLLLMRDANYPWFILVPNREGIREIYQLSDADRQQLLHESTLLSLALEQAFTPDKLNIAALGNVVPQLHLHHIVRYETDPAWPAPVWGKLPAVPYDDYRLLQVIEKLKGTLGDEFSFAPDLLESSAG